MTIKAYKTILLPDQAIRDWDNQSPIDILDVIAERAILLPLKNKIFVASRLSSIIDVYLKSTQNESWISKRLWDLLIDIEIQHSLASEGFYKEDLETTTVPSSLENTAMQFGFFWPKSSESSRAELDQMAYIRLKDITSHYKDMKDRISEQGFLDIGCGPGRYIRGIRESVTDCHCIGIDASQDIIDYNQVNNCDKHVSYLCDDLLAAKVGSKYGLVMCNGVAHHTTYTAEAFIPVHANLVVDDGFYFLFMYGDGGIELKTWEILQSIVREVPVELAYNTLQSLLNPLRLQGQLDHMYGVFYRSRPEYIRALLQDYFSSVRAIEGVPGLDITPSTMKHLTNDEFKRRFGTGNIRFICRK